SGAGGAAERGGVGGGPVVAEQLGGEAVPVETGAFQAVGGARDPPGGERVGWGVGRPEQRGEGEPLVVWAGADGDVQVELGVHARRFAVRGSRAAGAARGRRIPADGVRAAGGSPGSGGDRDDPASGIRPELLGGAVADHGERTPAAAG